MKKLILLFLLCCPGILTAQYEYGFLSEHYFGRLPSARAEAMGKSYVSVDGDISTVYFNPAGVATIKGLEVVGNYTPPDFYLTKGYFRSMGLGYSFCKYLQLSLSQYHFDFGKSNFGGIVETPYSQRNTLTIASQPIKNLLVGLNTNYFVWEVGVGDASRTIHLDFGLIKKFHLVKTPSSQHFINIGASIFNLNDATTKLKSGSSTYKYDLPIIGRFGANYQFHFDTDHFADTLTSYQLMLIGEYQEVLNSKYKTAYRGGGEIVLFEILALRAGYYVEKEYDYGIPEYNKDEISAFTYGFGLQLPLHKLSKIPLNFSFDFTSLPQPQYAIKELGLDNFSTFALRVNWLIKRN